MNSRRQCLKMLGASAVAAAAGGCAATQTAASYERPYSRGPFVAPRISRDRVIREVVGLRPYRPSGFVVRSEKFDDKTIVHNYGHGGGGITLCWGSSALAVRETAGMEHRTAAVIGAGVMGLTSARLLQDAGWQVTIYTRDPSRHTTSNVAAGQWGPTSVFEEDKVTPAFESQFKFACRIGHHAHTNLGGRDYGIRWIENYYLESGEITPDYYLRELPELFASVADLGPGEHPFRATHVKRVVTMAVEPAIFLRRLNEDYLRAGGHIVIRDFRDRAEVLSLEESVIFNCTGLGAKALFGDDELTPAKGQLLFLPPDRDVDFFTIGGGRGVLYMMPRTDALLLGGTFKYGDWSTNPEPAETDRIIAEHQKIFENFG